jgi:hypothetical protein
MILQNLNESTIPKVDYIKHHRVSHIPQSQQSQDSTQNNPSFNGEKESEKKKQTESQPEQQQDELKTTRYAKITSKGFESNLPFSTKTYLQVYHGTLTK